jgi:hypothetical protein
MAWDSPPDASIRQVPRTLDTSQDVAASQVPATPDRSVAQSASAAARVQPVPYSLHSGAPFTGLGWTQVPDSPEAESGDESGDESGPESIPPPAPVEHARDSASEGNNRRREKIVLIGISFCTYSSADRTRTRVEAAVRKSQSGCAALSPAQVRKRLFDPDETGRRVVLSVWQAGATFMPVTRGARHDPSHGSGTFAGGRLVIWSGTSGLQAELTLYGSGVPIFSSERGALSRR